MSDDELLPKDHPRRHAVHKATVEFYGFWEAVTKKYGLTISEQLGILADEIRSIVASCVHSEREGH